MFTLCRKVCAIYQVAITCHVHRISSDIPTTSSCSTSAAWSSSEDWNVVRILKHLDELSYPNPVTRFDPNSNVGHCSVTTKKVETLNLRISHLTQCWFRSTVTGTPAFNQKRSDPKLILFQKTNCLKTNHHKFVVSLVVLTARSASEGSRRCWPTENPAHSPSFAKYAVLTKIGPLIVNASDGIRQDAESLAGEWKPSKRFLIRNLSLSTHFGGLPAERLLPSRF